MPSKVSHFRKYFSNFLKTLILVEMEEGFSIPSLLKKTCNMMHFEIIRMDKSVDIYR